MTIIEWSRPADYTLSCILDKKRNTDKEMQMGAGYKFYKQYRSKAIFENNNGLTCLRLTWYM